LDIELINITHSFIVSSPAVRTDIHERFSGKVSWPLLRFSERMAALGVRERSPERLLNGLVSLAIEGFRSDSYITGLIEDMIFQSALKIGIDPTRLYTQVAVISIPRVADRLMGFIERSEMVLPRSYIEVNGEDGFWYLPTYDLQGEDPTLHWLFNALFNSNSDVRIKAAEGINNTISNIKEILYLDKKSANIRRNLRNTILSWQNQVTDSMYDANPKSSSLLINNRLSIGKTRLIEYWNDVFNIVDNPEKQRERALDGLRSLQSIETVDTLILALKDKNYWVRVLIAEILGKIGSRRAIPSLVYLEQAHSGKSKQSERIRVAATTAIAKIQAGGELGL
jgi:hypothetical protein